MLISHHPRANRQGMGIAVRFDNNRARAVGVDTLVESPDLARELGERSRKRALEQFSANRILSRFEVLYRRVIAI
jgi:glycosyltransferase involved in cell wall biosynthesis